MLTIDDAITIRKSTLSLNRHGDGNGPDTPWGRAQSTQHFAVGITFFETAGHGGFLIAPFRRAEMPEALRKTDTRYCQAQWYEEDCEALLVAVAFPEFFTADERFRALRSLVSIYPKAYASYITTAHYLTHGPGVDVP